MPFSERIRHKITKSRSPKVLSIFLARIKKKAAVRRQGREGIQRIKKKRNRGDNGSVKVGNVFWKRHFE